MILIILYKILNSENFVLTENKIQILVIFYKINIYFLHFYIYIIVFIHPRVIFRIKYFNSYYS